MHLARCISRVWQPRIQITTDRNTQAVDVSHGDWSGSEGTWVMVQPASDGVPNRVHWNTVPWCTHIASPLCWFQTLLTEKDGSLGQSCTGSMSSPYVLVLNGYKQDFLLECFSLFLETLNSNFAIEALLTYILIKLSFSWCHGPYVEHFCTT